MGLGLDFHFAVWVSVLQSIFIQLLSEWSERMRVGVRVRVTVGVRVRVTVGVRTRIHVRVYNN